MEKVLKKWVVNDYFTPNIKAEVVLDTLLTEYITEIIRGQLPGQVGKLTFLTKEMSILEEADPDDRGSKIDYVLEDDNFVYLIELKTTKGSINARQASRYIKNCYHQSFGTALGDKLLRIMAKKYPKAGNWTIDGLGCAFQNIVGKSRPCADSARRYLKNERLASTYKYLYTVGQLLDNHSGEIRDLWQKPLKLIYLTPDGGRAFPQKPRKKGGQEQEDAEQKWAELRLKWDSLYIDPNNADSSFSLKTAALWLREQDAYAKLLADIITELYGGAKLTIYRGTHQIGGCCTEITCGGERILIDLGANLPDSDSPIRDDELVSKVFDGRPAAGLLFTHPHGDHYGLYKRVPDDVPMYIGPMAKDILKVLVSRLDYISEEKGLPAVERMQTYQAGQELGAFQNIRVLPLYVDHSAPDAYMFYIEAAGKKILFSGDFRDHGIVGKRDRLWRTLEKYVPKGIDLLITEGTMLSREAEVASNPVRTEEELGQRAAEVFQRSKYNFVLVSSTNLDSIMEFYNNTPAGMHFVCDPYQAQIMITAMRDMEPRKISEYRLSRQHPVVRVLGKPDNRWAQLREIGEAMQRPLYFKSIRVEDEELERDGFVLLARKNANPKRKSIFEEMRDRYYPLGGHGQIIYSMWDGYLKPEHADQALIDFIGGRPYEQLHTSGHAYVETIVRLIEMVQPKWVVPMHTEKADEFTSIPKFAPYKSRVQVLTDGMPLDLDKL